MITKQDSCAGCSSSQRLFPSITGGGSDAIRIASFGAANAMQLRITPGFQRCYFNRSFIMKFKDSIYRLAMVAGLLVGVIPQAFAQTAAGVTISNTASVVYDVGSVTQTAVISGAADFVVDRRINVTVAETGNFATIVVPGATGQLISYTVTNNSNATLDFAITVAQDITGTITATGGTDSFNVTGPVVHVDANNNNIYDLGEDATFIDEMLPGAVRTVFVVSDIPGTAVNGGVASLTLTATAYQDTVLVTGAYAPSVGSLASAPAAQTNTGTADNPTFIDTVFGDVAGRTDGARNGDHSAGDQYNVVTAALTVTKSSTVVSDPFNLLVNPKAIPGAVIEYCLDIANGGSAAASSIVMTDAIPANTAYLPNSIKVSAVGAGTACTLNSGTADDDDALAEAATSGDYNETTVGAVTIRAPSIAAAARFKAIFRVTVQ
jgi:uncharacterized repeat protein (TIGR01451 family)